MPTIYGNRFGGASIRHSSVPGTGLSGLRETHSSVLTGNTKSRTENKRGIADVGLGKFINASLFRAKMRHSAFQQMYYHTK